jgi:hypothetical protein
MVSLVLEYTVEGGVNLYRRKLAGVIIKPTLLRQVFRIKATLPVVVRPPGGADEKDGLVG